MKLTNSFRFLETENTTGTQSAASSKGNLKISEAHLGLTPRVTVMLLIYKVAN